MDIIIKSFQSFYKFDKYLNTEKDLGKNIYDILLESNITFGNLLITLIKFHFQKNTITNFNHSVEHVNAYNLVFQLANEQQLQNLFDFSIYFNLHKSKSTLIKQTIPSMYPEVIYIVQFIDHIFIHLLNVFKLLNKATQKSNNILKLELNIDEKKIFNRIDNTLKPGDNYLNELVANIDIITYLIFLNTDTIPLELFGLLNRQLNIKNTKYLIFLINKFQNIIKDDKICYITPIVLNEFQIFEKKQSPTTTSPTTTSPIGEFVTLLTSKTTSPKHKIEAFIQQFIKLSEPIGQSILYSILLKLGFGARLFTKKKIIN
jgi:hypothetical protein